MAESAVNISSIKHKRPNIFELVAQESLMNNIHPALKKLCLFAAQKNSTIFGPILKWYEEVFLCGNFFLQFLYLKTFSSSFSEAFYGLRRIKAFSETVEGKLSRKAFLASLFSVTLLPYLKQKITTLIERYENEDYSQRDPKKEETLKLLIITNKAINTTYGTLRLFYLVSYATGSARIHDPLLKLSGVELVHYDRKMPGWKDLWMSLVTHKMRAPKVTLLSLLKLGALSLEIGAFFIQFLNWWHSDEAKVANLSKLPVPKAPHKNSGSVLCPICLRQRKNEVALITSGYVFCYLCIKKYLDEKGMCPVTNLPSNENNLVRIYSDDTS